MLKSKHALKNLALMQPLQVALVTLMPLMSTRMIQAVNPAVTTVMTRAATMMAPHPVALLVALPLVAPHPVALPLRLWRQTFWRVE